MERMFGETDRIMRLIDPLREVRDILEPLARMQANVPDYRDSRDKLKEEIESAFDLQGSIARLQDDPLISGFNRGKALFEQTFGGIDELARSFTFRTAYPDLRELIRDWSNEARGHLKVLLSMGWCLDPYAVNEWAGAIAQKMEDGEAAEAEAWLIEYFRGHASIIEDRVSDQSAARAPLLRDAFAAHREGRYALSIPVMLAQAEGLARDVMGLKLFSKAERPNARATGTLRLALISAFYEKANVVIRNTDELPQGFDGLNRHAVLHGIDSNYATEVNGLRAISLLNLVAFLASHEDEVGEILEVDDR